MNSYLFLLLIFHRTKQLELLGPVGLLRTEQLEQNSLSYLVWFAVSNRTVRTEQLELLGPVGRLKTEQLHFSGRGSTCLRCYPVLRPCSQSSVLGYFHT